MRKICILFSTLLFIAPLFTNYPIQTVVASGKSFVDKTKDETNSYTLILSALLKNQRTGQFDSADVSYEQVGALIQKVIHENPEVLYFDSAMSWSTGDIEFSYSVPDSTIKKNKAALSKEIDRVLEQIIKPGFTNFDKVKAIHDYLVSTVAYDYRYLQKNTIPVDSYTAYGSLLKGVAVCEGYTKAAQLLFNRLGIENYYVDGYGNGAQHSWNLVNLNGQYYFMDITWDEPVPNVKGAIGYKYFLISSDQLRKDHKWNEADWPVAKSKKYSFFTDFKTMKESKDYYFYSSLSDSDTLYRMKKDGGVRQKVNNVRAPYFALSDGWIYFSNYSKGGFLYKMKTDGSNIQQLNSAHSVDLVIIDKQLLYTDSKTGKAHKLILK